MKNTNIQKLIETATFIISILSLVFIVGFTYYIGVALLYTTICKLLYLESNTIVQRVIVFVISASFVLYYILQRENEGIFVKTPVLDIIIYCCIPYIFYILLSLSSII